MENRQVPNIVLNDGNTMPQLGLGVWRASDDDVEQAVTWAIDAGYRLVDTATIYRNEEGVGRAIAASSVPRKDLFITTKLWNSDQGADKVRPAFEESLAKLGLDYVDLYLIHWAMPAKGLFIETWKEFEKLQREGKIRSIGVSNFPIEQLKELMAATDVVPVVNQIELNPHLPQHELRDFCTEHDIHVESWSPIGGSHGGKDGSLLSDSVVTRIAGIHGKSSAQVVIRWHIQNGLIVIPKSVHKERIEQNIDVFDFELSSEEMTELATLENGYRHGPDPATMNLQ